jgi:hypothetical protein
VPEEKANELLITISRDQFNQIMDEISEEVSALTRQYIERYFHFKFFKKKFPGGDTIGPSLGRIQKESSEIIFKTAITLRPSPDGKNVQLDLSVYKDLLTKYLMDLNRSADLMSNKFNTNFFPIRRNPSSSGGPLRTEDYLEIYNKLGNFTPPREDRNPSSATYAHAFKALRESKSIPLDPKSIPPGWKQHSKEDEYFRLLEDKEMKKDIVSLLSIAYFGGELEEFNPQAFSLSAQEANVPYLKKHYDELTSMFMQLYALKAVDVYNERSNTAMVINKNKDTIITVPAILDYGTTSLKEMGKPKSMAPMFDPEYIKGIAEISDKSPVPSYSKSIKKINLLNTSQYSNPKKVSSGELAHANAGTMEINVFYDKINSLHERYVNGTPEFRDYKDKEFAIPGVYGSLLEAIKYGTAHELGHIMSYIAWDHAKDISEDKQKYLFGLPLPMARLRGNKEKFRRDLSTIKKNQKVSVYGDESGDEYFAEAYAKYIYSGDITDEFKEILEKAGIEKGKPKKIIYDDSSTNPSERSFVSDIEDEKPLLDNEEAIKIFNDAIVNALSKYSLDELDTLSMKLGLTLNPGDRASVETISAGIYRSIKSQWNGSSNFIATLILMRVAKDTLNLEGSLPITGRTKDSEKLQKRAAYEEVYSSLTPKELNMVEDLVKAQYDTVQTYLGQYGIREVPVYRGWRNASDIAEDGRVRTRPLSSFSLRYLTAQSFTSETGAVTVAVIPAEKIFGISANNFGVSSEQEIVVLGGSYRMYVVPDSLSPRSMKDIEISGVEVEVEEEGN